MKIKKKGRFKKKMIWGTKSRRRKKRKRGNRTTDNIITRIRRI